MNVLLTVAQRITPLYSLISATMHKSANLILFHFARSDAYC